MNKTEQFTAAQWRTRGCQPKQQDRGAPAAPQPSGNLYPAIRPFLWIGIDPGVSCGFALWQARQGSQGGQFLEVTTLSFVATIRRLEKLVREFGPAALRARVENPSGNLPTFDKGVAPTVENIKKREKMSQNVGSNKRDAQLLLDFLDNLGIPYDAVVPQATRSKAGKVTAAFFTGVKGFPTRSSQHSRDAAQLVIGL